MRRPEYNGGWYELAFQINPCNTFRTANLIQHKLPGNNLSQNILLQVNGSGHSINQIRQVLQTCFTSKSPIDGEAQSNYLELARLYVPDKLALFRHSNHC